MKIIPIVRSIGLLSLLIVLLLGCTQQQAASSAPAASAEELEIDSGISEADGLDQMYTEDEINFEELENLPLE